MDHSTTPGTLTVQHTTVNVNGTTLNETAGQAFTDTIATFTGNNPNAVAGDFVGNLTKFVDNEP